MPRPYDESFFADIAPQAARSARRIVPEIAALLAPRSVVDVGCGTGVWLREFVGAGADRILGIDGAHVVTADLVIPPESFMTADLEAPVPLAERFDLAMSLEVAEHLSPSSGLALIELLTRAAPAVLFSAALPGQGGRHHVNEQWLDHWVGQFEREGFEAIDCIRRRFWDDADVTSYYAQNAVLFLAADHPAAPAARALSQPLPWRVVHPGTLEHTARPRGLGDLIREVPAALRRTVAARRGSAPVAPRG